MTTSTRGRYRVQTINRDTGVEKWVVVEADGKAGAVESVAELDVVVGEAEMIEIDSSPIQDLENDTSTDPGLIVVQSSQDRSRSKPALTGFDPRFRVVENGSRLATVLLVVRASWERSTGVDCGLPDVSFGRMGNPRCQGPRRQCGAESDIRA